MSPSCTPQALINQTLERLFEKIYERIQKQQLGKTAEMPVGKKPLTKDLANESIASKHTPKHIHVDTSEEQMRWKTTADHKWMMCAHTADKTAAQSGG